MAADFLYLASASPRRRELLRQIGVAFEVLRVEVDESPLPAEEPLTYVNRVAAAKAQAGWQARTPVSGLAPVLAADTTVVLEGRLFGKPKDEVDAADMLMALSGRTHQVLTAVALREAGGLRTCFSRSHVTFRHIESHEALAYGRTGEPLGKAGGYAIQGLAAVFVADLHGSYSGVMGLPLFETAQLLGDAGVPRWTGRSHGH